jgi:5-methylcytosine-specific restriction endonuclease McrA
VYCSSRCRNASNNAKARQDGKYDEMLRRRRQQTEDRRQENARPCPYCSGQVLQPRAKHCGAANCKRAFNAERARAWHRKYTAETGQRYGGVNYPEREREHMRRRREEQGHWRKQYPERAALADARRRMRMDQARTGEVFAPIDVHTRDEWTCQLCWLPIDPEVAWPDRMSPSIDHVIPLSRGGAHSMSNTQSAHLGCNSRKAARLTEGS